jgi:hypothetical protein
VTLQPEIGFLPGQFEGLPKPEPDDQQGHEKKNRPLAITRMHHKLVKAKLTCSGASKRNHSLYYGGN